MSRLANTIRIDYLAVLHPQSQVRLFARQVLPHTCRLRTAVSCRLFETTRRTQHFTAVHCRDPGLHGLVYIELPVSHAVAGDRLLFAIAAAALC